MTKLNTKSAANHQKSFLPMQVLMGIGEILSLNHDTQRRVRVAAAAFRYACLNIHIITQIVKSEHSYNNIKSGHSHLLNVQSIDS
jgi:hypothetical protein